MGWHCPFRIGTLTSRRRSPRIGSSYPIPEFGLLAESARTCVEKTRSDDMVDQTVVGAVNGVVDELTVERKQIPGEVLFEADRFWNASFSSATARASTGTNLPVFKLGVGLGGKGCYCWEANRL